RQGQSRFRREVISVVAVATTPRILPPPDEAPSALDGRSLVQTDGLVDRTCPQERVVDALSRASGPAAHHRPPPPSRLRPRRLRAVRRDDGRPLGGASSDGRAAVDAGRSVAAARDVRRTL